MGPVSPIGSSAPGPESSGQIRPTDAAAVQRPQAEPAQTRIESTSHDTMISFGSSDRPDEDVMRRVLGLALAMQILEMLSGGKKDEEDSDNALAMAMFAQLASQADQSRSTMLYSRTEVETHTQIPVSSDQVQATYQAGGGPGTAAAAAGDQVSMEA